MNDFYRTGMGHRFYEGTMPALVAQLTRLNDLLEKLIPVVADKMSKGEKDERDQHG